MDEALATVAIDFAGRYSFQFSCPFTREKVGDLSTELVLHFGMLLLKMRKLTCTLGVENGTNEHHKIEGIFKAAVRAIRMACEIDPRSKQNLLYERSSLESKLGYGFPSIPVPLSQLLSLGSIGARC